MANKIELNLRMTNIYQYVYHIGWELPVGMIGVIFHNHKPQANVILVDYKTSNNSIIFMMPYIFTFKDYVCIGPDINMVQLNKLHFGLFSWYPISALNGLGAKWGIDVLFANIQLYTNSCDSTCLLLGKPTNSVYGGEPQVTDIICKMFRQRKML